MAMRSGSNTEFYESFAEVKDNMNQENWEVFSTRQQIYLLKLEDSTEKNSS